MVCYRTPNVTPHTPPPTLEGGFPVISTMRRISLWAVCPGTLVGRSSLISARAHPQLTSSSPSVSAILSSPRSVSQRWLGRGPSFEVLPFSVICLDPRSILYSSCILYSSLYLLIGNPALHLIIFYIKLSLFRLLCGFFLLNGP